jgi:integrase
MMGKLKAAISERSFARLASGERGKRSMHAVGGIPGLYLSVGEENARSWLLRYSFDGKRRHLGLGSAELLTLAEAREKAHEQRKLIAQGIDPLKIKREKRDARIAANAVRKPFSACVDGYLDTHGDGWRNPRHLAQWRATLERYAFPVFGALDVTTVDTALVLRVLEPIWKTKTETASRLRGRIENVLSWASARGYRSGENPARWRGHLDQLLARPSKIAPVKHFAALPYQELGTFMQALGKQEGIGARALEFAILTAARSGEVRGARWDEIDLQARTWAIPAERMKANREHVVPLSDAALAVIKKMNETRFDELIFPGAKEGRPLSDMSVTAVLRRMGRGDLTAHGFRSSFRDWAAELTAYPSEIAEMALAHVISNKTEAAYRRGSLLAKRVRMMADWARYCGTVPAGDVVLPMKRTAVTA